MRDDSPPDRFRGLPWATVIGREVRVAVGRRSRLLGLSLLEPDRAGPGLLIPGCSSVHTFGMRFALDLWFLDHAGAPLSLRRRVPPRRFAWERSAAAVLEIPVPYGFRREFSASEGGESGPRRP